MATVAKKELREMNCKELETALAEHRQTLRTMRFDVHSAQKKTTHDVRQTKKSIARILTIAREKTCL